MEIINQKSMSVSNAEHDMEIGFDVGMTVAVEWME